MISEPISAMLTGVGRPLRSGVCSGPTGMHDTSEDCLGKGRAMRSRIALLSALRWGLVGLVLAGMGGPAARGATLRWKFRPGETLHYVMDQKTVTTAKL